MSTPDRPEHSVTVAEAREHVLQVLDGIDITDVVYHEFEHTRPLVDDLMFQLLNHVAPGGSVALFGGNSLLAHAILKAGYDLTVWRFGTNLLDEELESVIRGELTMEMLADGQLPFERGMQWEGIVLPLVLEHLPASPVIVFDSLRRHLHRAGALVLATRNLGSMGIRARALRGKPYLPDWKAPEVRFSLNWPDEQSFRFYFLEELVNYAKQADLECLESSFSLGWRAYSNAEVFGIRGFISRIVKFQNKRIMRPLRDFIVISLGHKAARAEQEPDRQPQANMDERSDPSFNGRPMVSVVLPTRNRASMLRDSFAGLQSQTYPADLFEVIVVNDGSTDDTEAVAERLIQAAPFAGRVVNTSGIGATAARNLGMQVAAGEIVAHLDDDCRPCPEWMDEAVGGFGTGVGVVGGPVVPKPEQEIPFFSFAPRYEQELGMYPSSNVFLQREAALQIGGYDETFGRNLLGRPVSGWDSDLGWRLRRAGYRSKFRSGAIAYQEVFRQRPLDWLLEGWRAITLPMGAKRVPELGRYLLYKRFFVHRITLYFDLAIIGAVLALALRHAAPLLLGVAWFAWLARSIAARDRWPPWRWPRAGIKLAFIGGRQLITFVALIIGSVWARRLLL